MCAMTLDAIMQGLNAAGYDAQRQGINDQINALPGQQAADTAALDTAKTNAFGDITNQANARGMTYSGMPIAEQSRYVGEKYLPAVANLKAGYAANRSKLAGSLASLNANQYKDAQDTLSKQQSAEADAVYKQQQMQLAQQRLSISASKASQPTAAQSKAQNYTDLKDSIGAYLRDLPKISKPGYSESVALPNLYNAFAGQISPSEINQLYYSARKAAGLG